MIKEYKVISDIIDTLNEGDILKYNPNTNEYFFTDKGNYPEAGYSYSRYVSLSSNVVEEYAKQGFLEAVEEKNEVSDTKVKKLLTEIKRLQNKYNQRKDAVEKKYNEGKMPTCQKVEHDTVYFNLMKVLNKLESIINE